MLEETGTQEAERGREEERELKSVVIQLQEDFSR